MATPKSPFYVIQDFITPKLCEAIVDNLGFYSPDVDTDGTPIKMIRYSEESETILYDRLQQYIPKLMHHYESEYRGTEQIIFEYHAQGTKPTPLCENSSYVKKKWARTRDRDFTGVLFLSDYNDNPPFDNDYEVYGGKLEFPQHQFGFNPQRGTLIVYPSGPHFINASADIFAGDLYQARIHIASAMPYLYQPEDFPGDYTTWFSDL